jgi:hypothetical protein
MLQSTYLGDILLQPKQIERVLDVRLVDLAEEVVPVQAAKPRNPTFLREARCLGRDVLVLSIRVRAQYWICVHLDEQALWRQLLDAGAEGVVLRYCGQADSSGGRGAMLGAEGVMAGLQEFAQFLAYNSDRCAAFAAA